MPIHQNFPVPLHFICAGTTAVGHTTYTQGRSYPGPRHHQRGSNTLSSVHAQDACLAEHIILPCLAEHSLLPVQHQRSGTSSAQGTLLSGRAFMTDLGSSLGVCMQQSDPDTLSLFTTSQSSLCWISMLPLEPLHRKVTNSNRSIMRRCMKLGGSGTDHKDSTQSPNWRFTDS